MNLCRRHIVTDCRPPWWPGRLFGGIAQFEQIIHSNVSQQLRICWAHLDSNISQQKRPAGKEWKEEKLSGAENGDILFQHNRQKYIKKIYLNYLLFVCLEIIDHLPSLSSLMNELLVARLCSAHLKIFMSFEDYNFFHLLIFTYLLIFLSPHLYIRKIGTANYI